MLKPMLQLYSLCSCATPQFSYFCHSHSQSSARLHYIMLHLRYVGLVKNRVLNILSAGGVNHRLTQYKI